jgi:hypothetical protein
LPRATKVSTGGSPHASGSPTDDLFRGFKTSPPDGFSPASFPPAQRGAGMHVMATEREENVTSPGYLGDTPPLCLRSRIGVSTPKPDR